MYNAHVQCIDTEHALVHVLVDTEHALVHVPGWKGSRDLAWGFGTRRYCA